MKSFQGAAEKAGDPEAFPFLTPPVGEAKAKAVAFGRAGAEQRPVPERMEHPAMSPD